MALHCQTKLYQISNCVRQLKKIKINEFRGVFVRRKLPALACKTECGILYSDDLYKNGTHTGPLGL